MSCGKRGMDKKSKLLFLSNKYYSTLWVMDNIQQAINCYQLACKDLGLEDIPDPTELDDPMIRLEKLLEIRIKEMLDSDFEGLINAFYRIDLSEKKVKEILRFGRPATLAMQLARAVIEREKQKVITREQYRS